MAQPERLKRRAQFLLVAQRGRKSAQPGLVLQALARPDGQSARLGFTVTRKVGNAVVRNRTRRRLRAAARLVAEQRVLGGFDLVMIGRDGTRARPFPELIGDIGRALDRCGVGRL